MKILQVRFQNLNSLIGCWHIDFTDPAYAENSLFAITGPTGAGKSTLLDAVCLALYGRTPRLAKISKNSNEIMSRHTGVCFAEVEFETVKGHFRCHWSQHRSRQKANGELQQPKHEIANVADNTILENRMRDVLARVEEVTGMDFDRFTRSTLLAQGGFAAFLQASPDHRAPLLEQITGTEIYSRLSIKVHELQKNEQGKLQELEQTLEHTTLLTPEEEQELKEMAAAKGKQCQQLSKKSADMRDKLAWLTTLRGLKSEIEGYHKHLRDLEEEEKSHAPILHRLVPGLAAQQLEAVYLEHNTLLATQSRELHESKQLSEKLAELLHLRQQAKKSCQEGNRNLQQAETEEKNGQQLIKQVHELDLRLHTTEKQLQEQTELVKTQQQQVEKEGREIRILDERLAREAARKKELDIFFQQHGGDEQLVEEFSALQVEISSLLDRHKQGTALSLTKKEAEHLVQQKKQAMTFLRKEESALHSQETEIGKTLHRLQEETRRILQEREPETVQQDLFQAQNRKRTVEDLLLLVEEKASQIKKLDTLRGQIRQEGEQEETITQELSRCSKEIAALQQKIILLEKNLLLLVRIQKLEAERKQLRHATPCPLCGSTVHPYSQGNAPPVLSEEETRLQDTKKELQTLEKRHAELTRQGIVCSEQQKGLSKHISTSEEEVALKEKRAEELLADLDLPPLDQVDLQLLTEEKKKLSQECEGLQQRVHSLQKIDKQLAEAGEKEKELAKLRQQYEKDLLQAEHKISSAEQESRRLLQEEQALFMELEKISTSLFTKLAAYGIREPTLITLPVTLEELGKRAEEWKKKKEEEGQEVARSLTLSSELSHKQEYLQKLTGELRAATEQCEKTRHSLADLTITRTALFGSKKTEEEAERLALTVRDARKRLEHWNSDSNALDNKITAARTLQEKLASDNRKRQQEIEKQEKRLHQALSSSPFADLDQFLAARVEPEELEQLANLQKTLQERKTKLLTLCQDRKRGLQKEEARQLCDEEEPTLKQKLSELENQLAELQQQAGGAQERLKKNSSDKQAAAEKLTLITSQKKVVGRWNRLHMLIGSADGKKFRNFAQGLTFELMISQANRSLRRMSDRYILVRDKLQPLDLNVIDTYQAGEIRSTRNLSGGESFLVSLSLALGLSRMASQNVRVDSLFLDEGFGTLDEESLETALDTLALLREDNKLIGIISHVGALKERIPLQIEIVPGPGGRSTIKGPGATQEH